MFGYDEGRSRAELLPVLEVRKLTKVVDSERVALASVDLSVRPGQIKGLISSNSFTVKTLFELIVGLKSADAGTIFSGSSDSPEVDDSQRAKFGFLPEQILMPYGMNGFEYLRLMTDLSGMDREQSSSQIASIAERLGIGEVLGSKCSELHASERRLLALAGAGVHSPELLLLDEPTKEMDVFAEGRVKDFLKSITEAGGAILITSREMGVIEKLAKDLVVFSESRVVYDGPISLIGGFGSRNVLTVQIEGLHGRFESALAAPLAGGILSFRFDGDQYSVIFDEALLLTEMLRIVLEAAEESGVILRNVGLQAQDLDEAVRKILINAPVQGKALYSSLELDGQPVRELPSGKDIE